MNRIEMELRNMPRFRIMEYLEEAGGEPVGELVVEGDGWTARLEEMEPAKVGKIFSIRRDCLIIEGDEDIIQPVYDHLRQRTLRGGG